MNLRSSRASARTSLRVWSSGRREGGFYLRKVEWVKLDRMTVRTSSEVLDIPSAFFISLSSRNRFGLPVIRTLRTWIGELPKGSKVLKSSHRVADMNHFIESFEYQNYTPGSDHSITASGLMLYGRAQIASIFRGEVSWLFL